MFLQAVSALRSPTVAELTKESFFSFTGDETGVKLVMFYGKNCPACVDTEGIYEETSRMYWQEPRVKFAQFDCDKWSDVCDSIQAHDFPVWMAWFPQESHPKRYNRNFNPEQFQRWIRQQTGIWPHSSQNNLLYYKKHEVDMLRKKSQCLWSIIDTPRMAESQLMHNASRNLEMRVKRGAKFIAIEKEENSELANKVLGSEKWGAYLFSKGKWNHYTGKADPQEIASFLKQSCPISLATPTPTPEPLPELEDIPDDPIPTDDQGRMKFNKADEEDSDDEDIVMQNIKAVEQSDSEEEVSEEEWDFNDDDE